MNYQFLSLDEDDLVECAQLYVNTFKDEPWNEDWDLEDAFNRLHNFLTPPYSIGLKVVNESEIQGFLIGEIEQWRGSQSFYLREICISKKMQGLGLGKKLMHTLNNELIAKNVSRVYLVTQRDTTPESFYRALGFKTNDKLIVMGKSVNINS
ncbi:GNAT family N-acetyltransferase [Endozoicomonas sp. SM1973]|uniref:GNAT family N-acetyltransferase n=1 Tax=Spartinivicinus marinus TaxID=2994442 RepID=A0A853IE32_9GAMM|nr:GNAT family N-acetyltransferase [Spartinivicinus marinus]MCX4029148.1 GNAT family N-acetyltransferase [Spartinivicinus marinus]NYZ67767.1 GNAT family N-acetyltransferase [Spartinivicinus marinus]